jgi:hypothetical protein
MKVEREHWNEHIQKSAEKSHENKVTILWNQKVKTDRTIRKTKLDILIRDSEKKIFFNAQLQFEKVET